MALRWPAPSGENVTKILQVPPAGYAPEQALEIWKSPGFAPPGTTEEMCSGPGPTLVTVIVCAMLALPWVVVANVRLPGTAGSGAAPMPLSGTNCGLPEALSVVAKLACRAPATVGEKTKLTVQVAFGERAVGREQLGVATKSAELEPVTLMDVMLSA